MTPSDLRIEVKSAPDSGCNVLRHFMNNWVKNIKIHPKVKQIRYFLAEGGIDEIRVLDTDGNVHLKLEKEEALRLDKVDACLTYLITE